MLIKKFIFILILMILPSIGYSQISSEPVTIKVIRAFTFVDETSSTIVTPDVYYSSTSENIKNFLVTDEGPIMTFKCEQALFQNKSRLDIITDHTGVNRYNNQSRDKSVVKYQFFDKQDCKQNANLLMNATPEEPVYININYGDNTITGFGKWSDIN